MRAHQVRLSNDLNACSARTQARVLTVTTTLSGQPQKRRDSQGGDGGMGFLSCRPDGDARHGMSRARERTNADACTTGGSFVLQGAETRTVLDQRRHGADLWTLAVKRNLRATLALSL